MRRFIIFGLFSACALGQSPGNIPAAIGNSAAVKPPAVGATALFQAAALAPNPASIPSPIIGAKVESVKLDPSGQTSTVRIRNLSDKTITAFDFVIQSTPSGRPPQISDFSYSLRDLLPGTHVTPIEGIAPGKSHDEVLHISSAGVAVDLDVVVYSDATAEFSNREMFIQIMAGRKALADAAGETADIIRGSLSKAEAVYRLTQVWEESKMDHPLIAPFLETHLFNLRNLPGDSEAEQKKNLAEYADKNEKDAEFLSFHANLHRRTQ